MISVVLNRSELPGWFFILEVDDAKEQKQLKVQPHHISEMEIWHKVSHCQGPSKSMRIHGEEKSGKRKHHGINQLLSYNWCCISEMHRMGLVLKPTRRMGEYCFFWVAPGHRNRCSHTVCASLNLEGGVIPEANLRWLGTNLFNHSALTHACLLKECLLVDPG